MGWPRWATSLSDHVQLPSALLVPFLMPVGSLSGLASASIFAAYWRFARHGRRLTPQYRLLGFLGRLLGLGAVSQLLPPINVTALEIAVGLRPEYRDLPPQVRGATGPRGAWGGGRGHGMPVRLQCPCQPWGGGAALVVIHMALRSLGSPGCPAAPSSSAWASSASQGPWWPPRPPRWLGRVRWTRHGS